MDPISIVVAAITAGAVEALKGSAADAVKSAYEKLKQLVTSRYSSADLSAIEKKPESKAKQDSLREDLLESGAGTDPDLTSAAIALIDALRLHGSRSDEAIGVDLEDLRAEAMRIRDIQSSGTGVKVRGAEISGAVEIENVRSGLDQGPFGAR